MSEFRGGRIVSAAAVGIASALFAAGCSSPEKHHSSQSLPPLAIAGESFNCEFFTALKTLPEAGIPNAAQALAPSLNEPVSEVESEARYGISICQRSITASMAKEAGIVVDVPNIGSNYLCVTWAAIYENAAQASAGGPTDHIGLICVPKVATVIN